MLKCHKLVFVLAGEAAFGLFFGLHLEVAVFVILVLSDVFLKQPGERQRHPRNTFVRVFFQRLVDLEVFLSLEMKQLTIP